MTTKIAMPTTGEELREFVADSDRVSAVFSKEALADGTMKEFLDSHVKLRNARDAELQAQQREQMQLILAEFLQESGRNAPPVSLSASGRPVLGGRAQEP